MGVFHIFKIVQTVPNRAKHIIICNLDYYDQGLFELLIIRVFLAGQCELCLFFLLC